MLDWQQLANWLEDRAHRLRIAVMGAARTLARLVVSASVFAWTTVRPALMFLLNVLAALIVLFEEWGWRPIQAFLSRLARFPLWAKMEALIAGLPPYAALFTLAVPSVVLVPAKLIGVYMFATGHFFTALAVIFMAKVASTALIARIFLLTEPALMQIGWFARAYTAFLPWRDAWVEWVRASWVWRYGRVIKRRAKIQLHHVWDWLRPLLRRGWAAIVEHARPAWIGFRQFVRQSLGRPPLEPRSPRLLPPPDPQQNR